MLNECVFDAVVFDVVKYHLKVLLPPNYDYDIKNAVSVDECIITSVVGYKYWETRMLLTCNWLFFFDQISHIIT